MKIKDQVLSIGQVQELQELGFDVEKYASMYFVPNWITKYGIDEIQDYLLTVAEKNPDKIINLYTGDDINLRLLFIEARDKRVIYIKNKLYLYADNITLGATDDAALTWMKDPRNRKTLELIKQDTFPDAYSKEEIKDE